LFGSLPESMVTTLPPYSDGDLLGDNNEMNTLRSSTSHADALALYQKNEGNIHIAVNRFLRQYPTIISGAYDRDDMISDARLVLWRCCMLYDSGRGARISTLIFDAIYRRLIDRWRKDAVRIENGKYVRVVSPVSLTEPVSEGSTITIEDNLANIQGGGRWGDNGPSVLLHKEMLKKAKAVWESREPSRRAKSPVLASEIFAVFCNQGVEK
jgi:DNA-directed RNA polymerase specialized sigma24 family protein